MFGHKHLRYIVFDIAELSRMGNERLAGTQSKNRDLRFVAERATRLLGDCQPALKMICEVGVGFGDGGDAAIAEMYGFLFCYAALFDVWIVGRSLFTSYCTIHPQRK